MPYGVAQRCGLWRAHASKILLQAGTSCRWEAQQVRRWPLGNEQVIRVSGLAAQLTTKVLELSDVQVLWMGVEQRCPPRVPPIVVAPAFRASVSALSAWSARTGSPSY
mmetsp:Transcript_32914/g.86459  ORF Transcript_32914/g.86459 Transcript_32914/m.86459 type:complete len:108 (-) Transcript_32914:445-768(-)